MREEMWHPMFVHFPIALISSIIFIRILDFGVLPKAFAKGSLQKVYFLVFSVGLGSFALSLFLGDIAVENAVNVAGNYAKITAHEQWAYYTLYAFLFVAFLDWLLIVLGEKKINKNILLSIEIIVFITLFLGNYFLVETGHRGALLVYELGIGVLK